MPAYFDEGFTVRKPAWHGLATVLDEYPGRDEAMKAAGHDFTIGESTVSYMAGDEPMDAEDWKVLYRTDTNAPMGVVRSGYEVVQNDALWDLVDGIVDMPNVKYETAGVLRGGSVLWVLARHDIPHTIKGDNTVTYPYLLATTQHDGCGACKVSAVHVRVVCWNTWTMAAEAAKRDRTEYTIRHTAKASQRIQEAREALHGVVAQHEHYIKLANELAYIGLSEDQVQDFTVRLVPEPTVDIITPRVRANIAKARLKFREVLAGPTIPDAHRRDGFGLWQAGIEFIDHYRKSRTKETYFSRNVMRTEPLKAHLVDLIKDCAK